MLTYELTFPCIAVSAQSECHDIGGWCGDAAFDECPDGTWDYGVDCDPSFSTCCVPDIPPTTTTTTAGPPTTTTPLDLNSTSAPPSTKTK